MTTSTVDPLAALAALLAPDRAARILALLAPPAATLAAERAERWTALPRADRLSAVSRVLISTTPGPFASGATVPQALVTRLHRDVSALRTQGAALRRAADARWHAP